ncbi:ras association domain-containing 10-like protein [Labeo rohita]|uniref:Ras association domain-containing 10-like protein n=1 Tax=Labeo rohita TaxID=84645 RepID=A0A498LPJ6_LABRO|nr:ras association domain-containing protein 10 [Labeo rohita]RXN10319.1 ras association domain-containing 10-like protein [Labeo rohita]
MTMEQEESKISVWVCREEKLVSGLSRRTTCADVVKVLLEDQNFQKGAMLTGPPQSYCIVEKWRGFERILPNKTKILRLWSAWGDEQENVRFVLVRSDASLPNSGPRSAEARVVLSKESPCTTRATMQISQDKQRRIVRKAFRKLDKINRKKEEVSKDKPSAEKMETLVHLIISQDHTIRQQVQRIKELDGEIERYESKVHFDRMKIHGVNYVQDTYLLDQGLDTDPSAHPDASYAQFEEYASRCDQVIQLQEELAEREALMEILTGEIQEELNHRWMRRRQEELSSKDAESTAEETVLKVTSVPEEPVPDVPDLLTDNELQLEEERIKTQLDTSLYIGLRLNTDLETVKSDLDMSQELLDAKEKELRELLEKVHRLDELESKQEDESKDDGESELPPSVDKDNVWVEQARGLAKTCTNDDDSDTGLSSMHSQDSDNAPVCESLV